MASCGGRKVTDVHNEITFCQGSSAVIGLPFKKMMVSNSSHKVVLKGETFKVCLNYLEEAFMWKFFT